MAPALTKPASRLPALWKTYVVVGVCAALAAYVFLVDRKREDKPEAPKEKVFALDKAKV